MAEMHDTTEEYLETILELAPHLDAMAANLADALSPARDISPTVPAAWRSLVSISR